MDLQTKAVWDFMEVAYRGGLLDEISQLAGGLLDPDIDLGELLASFEDALVDAELGPFEEMSKEILVPSLVALTDEDVIEDLKYLLQTLRPLIEGMVRGAGGNMNVVADIARGILENIVSLRHVAVTLAPVISKVALPYIEIFLRERAGKVAGSGINSFCAMINRINDGHPETIPVFVSDLFDTVDPKEFKKATDILVECFLDQRPPLIGWTVATVIKRAKKRLLG